jgi:hypothetical protein
MKNSVRRGLFHPDDIKIVGLANFPSPGPMSAPLPLSKKKSRPSISPIVAVPASGSQATRSPHIRSSSFVGSFSNSGSFGRSEAKKINSDEFEKYTETDDEDYEDVFGKLNGTSKFPYPSISYGHMLTLM